MKTLSHHADHYEPPPIVHKTVFGNKSAFPATAENAVAPPFDDDQIDIVARVIAEIRDETQDAIDAALAPLQQRIAVLEAQVSMLVTLLGGDANRSIEASSSEIVRKLKVTR